MDVFPTSRFRVQATKISTLESSETLNRSRNLNLVMNIPSLIKSKDSTRMCSWIYIYGDGQNKLADGRKSSHYFTLLIMICCNARADLLLARLLSLVLTRSGYLRLVSRVLATLSFPGVLEEASALSQSFPFNLIPYLFRPFHTIDHFI